MRILIGGSPSTGSSVFRQILNRHPAIFCGPETNLFCYRELYRAWNFNKWRILQKRPFGLVHCDARVIRGVQLTDAEIGWNTDELQKLIGACKDFVGFCEAYFDRPLKNHNKQHWAEKTPANVLQFRAYMQSFDDAFIIHTIRNPYDTVSSLVARGMSPIEASAVCLIYTAHGLAARDMAGYLEVRYEELVREPGKILDEEVLKPLGLAFSGSMLTTGNPEMTGESRMQGWRSDERDHISGKSVSRFDDEPEEFRKHLETAIAMVRIRPEYLRRHQLAHDNFQDLCFAMKYPYHTIPEAIREEYAPRLIKELQAVGRKGWISRLLAMVAFPVVLSR